MEKISVVIPCYNEKDNIKPMSENLVALFANKLNHLDYEVIFIDNASDDGTKEELEIVCNQYPQIKAIFNIKNFGAYNSPYYALLQASGDAVVLIACDFQEPIDLIPTFIEKWQEGHEIVVGIKTKSKENPLMYHLRTIYYSIIKRLSNVNIIRHFTGFGLYDQKFIAILRDLKDSSPFLRGVVAEYGHNIYKVEYEQPLRKNGKTHHSFSDLYDAAMLSFTSYTTLGLRIVTAFGLLMGVFSFIIGIIYLIYKLLHWYTFNAGVAPILIGIFFIGGLVLITLGLIGEYVISINRRSMNKPLVIEEKRINFDKDDN